MATTGQLTVGTILTATSGGTVMGTGISTWNVVAAGTAVEVISIYAGSGGVDTISTFTVRDTDTENLIHSAPIGNGQNLVITYPSGSFPKLNGLTIVSPDVNTTVPISFSVTYRLT